jgi:hypothetical protein
MPSRRPSRITPDQRTMAVFAACALAAALTWLLGISLRTPLWTDDIRKLTDPGMSRSFPRLNGMMSVVLVLLLAGSAYLGCLWALRRGFPHAWEAAVAATALCSLAWLPSSTLSSPDAIHLAADVRTFWLHGEFPAAWDGRPSQIDDPIARAVVHYKDRPSGYGPVAYAVGGIPLPLVGDGVRANLLGQKVVSGIFLVLTAAAAGAAARSLGHNAGFATGFVGLNPMMLWQFPGDAHNDTIMAALGILAIPLLLVVAWRGRLAGAGVALLSVLAKYGLLVAAPVVLAYWFPRWRKVIAIAALAFAALVMGGLIAAGAGLGLGTIGPASAIPPITPWYILHGLADYSSESRRLIGLLAYSLFGLIVAAIVWKHPLETRQDAVVAAATTLFLFLFVCTPGFLPWYQVWYLPVVAVAARRWLTVTALVFSLGSWLPLIAFNWRFDIERQMDISDPMQKASVILWLVTAAVAIALYRGELMSRALETVDSRRARRAAPRRAIRARR